MQRSVTVPSKYNHKYNMPQTHKNQNTEARHPNASNTKITNIGKCLVPQDVISPTLKNCIWDESVDCLIVAIQAGYRTTAVQQRLATVLHIRSDVHRCSADARANRVCVPSLQNKNNSSPMSSSSLQGNGDPLELLLQCPPIRGMALNDTIGATAHSSLCGLSSSLP